jgi:hypothetical protein
LAHLRSRELMLMIGGVTAIATVIRTVTGITTIGTGVIITGTGTSL